LAWIRSTLALLGVAVFIARLAFLADWRVGTGVAAAAVLFGAPMLGSTILRYERSRVGHRSRDYLPDGRLAGYTTAFVIVVGVAALAVVITR
jgi:uncharacterized membrane protein YidH (DUF202 family)